jgi:hypothetical protein
MREVMTAETWGVLRVWFEVLALLILLGESGYRGEARAQNGGQPGSRQQNWPISQLQRAWFLLEVQQNKTSSYPNKELTVIKVKAFRKVVQVTGPLLYSSKCIEKGKPTRLKKHAHDNPRLRTYPLTSQPAKKQIQPSQTQHPPSHLNLDLQRPMPPKLGSLLAPPPKLDKPPPPRLGSFPRPTQRKRKKRSRQLVCQ